MNKGEKIKLERIVINYFKEIHKIYTSNDFREESFYPALKGFIEECYCLFQERDKATVLVLPRETKAGIPDFRVGKNGEIIGYVEAKTPDTNLKEIEVSEQIKRYKNSLPNLILTNFLEFRLYKQGELIGKTEIGRQFTLQELKTSPTPEKLDLFFEILEKFFSFSIPEIQDSSGLSIELAKRTQFLKNVLQEELLMGNEQVTGFYKAFQEELIENLTKDRFADFYAQTITYGLFAARMKVRDRFKKEVVWEAIPETLPLLKEIFYSMTGPHFPESLKWIVEEISQVLEKADVTSILKEFKTTKWEEDPVIHFYETFLATYNPKERERLGVYYTPLPVVSYIVRSIHRLLKDKFGKSEGLATNDVTLLDPAAGTLTFVVQAIKQVQNELKERGKEGLITSYIEEHILPHFHAFEILVASYTVGHFKVSMILEDMGYKLRADKRFQFYLTNTLEMKDPEQKSFLIDLTKEAQEAKRVKEKVPILVVLGNPPYSVSSENKSDFIERLMDDYKEDVKKERNIQPLSDDYIKFIRFAHWKIEQAGKGILGFITNNSYLSGVIHRGMRKKLYETFNEIYILNLHGSSRIGEKTPEGGKDENVFDIQQGVTIAIYVKLEKSAKKKKVYYSDVWGLREEKYKYLFKNDIGKTKWEELKPEAPYYFFVPKDFSLQKEYDKFWKMTDIFKELSSGVVTHRDHFVVGFTKEEIIQKLRIFNGKLPDELVKESLKLPDTGTWQLSKAREKLKEEKLENKITKYAYRSFDIQWICYEPLLIDRDRWDLMQHLLLKDNIALVTTRLLSSTSFSHSFITNTIGDKCFISNKGKESNYFFPLYLYKQKGEERRMPRGMMVLFEPGAKYATKEPNFTPEFLQAIQKSLGQEPSPEEIFYYIYAVLYSPIYRKRYEEFLKIDFPRIPLPENYEVFQKLGALSKELIGLHLLNHKALDNTGISVSKTDYNTVEKVIYDEKKGRVYINKERYFEGISKEVWEYKIGAYQVMEKYLKDRKGRKLSLDEINHYMKVAKAIKLTIEMQESIDNVYREGGEL